MAFLSMNEVGLLVWKESSLLVVKTPSGLELPAVRPEDFNGDRVGAVREVLNRFGLTLTGPPRFVTKNQRFLEVREFSGELNGDFPIFWCTLEELQDPNFLEPGWNKCLREELCVLNR